MLHDFFDHTCSIYHFLEDGESPGYGLTEGPCFTYPEEANIAAVPCHFSIRDGSITIVQQEPQNLLEANIKLTCPLVWISAATIK